MHRPSNIRNVLVLCTGNSARSILGEAILNREGNGRLRAFSAGSTPTGRVNPCAIETLQKHGHPTDEFTSKSWDVFSGADAPAIDLVITVCGNAAGEICPVWNGAPLTTHWGLPDPAAVSGHNGAKLAAFEEIYHRLHRRVKLFLALPLGDLDEAAIQTRLDQIGALRDGDGGIRS